MQQTTKATNKIERRILKSLYLIIYANLGINSHGKNNLQVLVLSLTAL
jgi:hypothetical protein